MSDINQTPQTVEQTDEPKPVDVSASTENTTDKESSSFQYSNSHVTMDRKPFKYDIPKKYKNVKPLTSFGLSNVNLSKLETPNVNLIKQADDNWIQAYGHAYEDGIAGTIINKQDIDLEKAMNSGEWRQSIDYNGFKCAMDIPRVEPHTSGDKLTGTAAAAHIDAIIGGAKFIRIPLWASGFWITITTPAINELLNLRIKLQDLKEQIGRDTAGAIFSNRQALLTEDLASFIQAHIYECSVRNWVDVDLIALIKTTDWYPLLHAMSCAIYPEGYKYAIPCVHNPLDCNHVDEVILNLGKMTWTDASKVTTAQRTYMYEAISNAKTVEQVRAYQSDFAQNKDNVIQLNDKLKVVLRISSVADLIESGQAWIRDVTNILDRLAFRETTPQERQYLLRSHMTLNRIREFSHFVERFVTTTFVDGDERTHYIEDRTAIDDTIQKLANDEDLMEAFIEGVTNFITTNVVTIIATPNYICSNCQKPQVKENEDNVHPLLVVFDALMVFTTLMDRRL